MWALQYVIPPTDTSDRPFETIENFHNERMQDIYLIHVGCAASLL